MPDRARQGQPGPVPHYCGGAHAKPGRDLTNGKQFVGAARQATETANCLHRFTPIRAGNAPK